MLMTEDMSLLIRSSKQNRVHLQIHSCHLLLDNFQFTFFFMDLTIQVPMQYGSLSHQTLLPPPDISTTGDCFCFGSASSFLLELFIHSSPVAYWAPPDLGSSSFSVTSFYLFILFIRFLRQEC